MERLKMYFDSETRMIRRESLKVSTLCRYEPDPNRFTEGILQTLEVLRK